MCGYDTGIADSNPVRAKIRSEINDELAASEPARTSRDALCTFIREHALTDASRSLAQYVSLALFVTPPPELTITVDETELPPDANQVVGVLPLVRDFSDAVHLNALWSEHRAEYEGLIDRLHQPLRDMVLATNVYLHIPIIGSAGRRFLVLIEPMLAPTETNARIYGDDYVIVVSPNVHPADAVPMDLIRHTYLHYVIEPMIHAHSNALDRFQPLLRPVQDAPLEFSYKSDVVALLTECIIKAAEAHLMDVGLKPPPKPDSMQNRAELATYEEAMGAYERQAEAVRRHAVDIDMRQGWILVEYFYNQLGQMEKSGTSLVDEMGPMVYGMDVDREAHRAQQITFLPEGSGGDPAFRGSGRRTARPPAGLDLAELKLMKGDLQGADQIAEAALKTDPQNAQAHYLVGRINLMTGDPDGALDQLTETVKLSHDPRTIAWAHIYLGRMYDIAQDPQRNKAIAEYKAALANRDSQPDTKAAAEKGLKEPFALPKRTSNSSDDEPLDPTGKAEKEAYRPSTPSSPQR